MPPRKLAKIAVAALDDIKARDIAVLDVRKLTNLYDTLVIATAESNRQVKALASHVREQLEAAGATIIGVEGEATAEWVFHVPPHPREGGGVTWARVEEITRARLLMDRHLLDAASTGSTRRIVYVADTSCYGATGPRPITEDDPPRPSAWGRCLAPAFDRLDGYIAAGLPIVTALPGWAYGNASWFRERVIEPVLGGRPVLQIGTQAPWVSPIHVHDCARALVHLAERGEVGGRYFLVNTDPVRMDELAETFARLATRRLRVWRLPSVASRFVFGPLLADSLKTDAVFSNARLRGIGFRFTYPTLEHGLEQVVGALND